MYTQLKKARRWTEMIADRYSFPNNLAGLCAAGSCRVFLYLKRLGYTPKMIMNHDHCFVVNEDVIIDITATQFNLPEIHTESFPSSEYFYKFGKAYYSVGSLCSRQERDGWCKTQIYWNLV